MWCGEGDSGGVDETLRSLTIVTILQKWLQTGSIQRLVVIGGGEYLNP